MNSGGKSKAHGPRARIFGETLVDGEGQAEEYGLRASGAPGWHSRHSGTLARVLLCCIHTTLHRPNVGVAPHSWTIHPRTPLHGPPMHHHGALAGGWVLAVSGPWWIPPPPPPLHIPPISRQGGSVLRVSTASLLHQTSDTPKKKRDRRGRRGIERRAGEIYGGG